MAEISPVATSNYIFKNPADMVGNIFSAQNSKSGIRSEKSDTSVNKNSRSISENVRLRNLKKAGLVECETCKNRKYQDVSNDPGVSFKTPGHISPQSSAATVMSHEQEHVSHETSKASSEGRKVVSQSVTLYTAVCPECGRTYVSGGTTRTVTAGDDSKDYFKNQYQNFIDKSFGKFIDTRL